MIPIQTVLALLAVLLMFGCSQEAPPKPKFAQGSTQTGGTATGNQQTANPTDSGTQTIIGKGGRNEGKPDLPLNCDEKLAGKSELLIVPSDDGGAATLRLQGKDACDLYRFTQLREQAQKSEAQTAVRKRIKVGQHYRCERLPMNKYSCNLELAWIDGSATELQKDAARADQPELVTEEINDVYIKFLLNPATQGQSAAPFFEINLYGQAAMTLHQALKAGEVDATVQIANSKETKRVGRKNGKNFYCTRELSLDVNQESAYYCQFYGHLDGGYFEKIGIPANPH